MSKFNRETLINIIVFVLFAILTFIVGLHHEPWADEAQAWLIARDCTIPEMIFHVLKYEGHPILWFIILKFLIFLHFPYKLLFIISWIMTCFGVLLLLFKSKLPNIIKYLFPFTFFIFYQSAVIARNHSLLFPFLAIIAILYKKRLEHPYIYSILLILLASTSAYSLVIAFVLLCFFIYDLVSRKTFSIKNCFPWLIVLIYMIFTALYLIKPADYAIQYGLNVMRANPARILYIMTRCYFNTPPLGIVLYMQMLTVFTCYLLAGKTFCKTKYQTIFFISINFFLAIMITALVCNPWHSAYMIITLIFSLWVISEDNKNYEISFNKNKCLYIVLALIFTVHIFWNIKCSLYDYKNNYCASKDVAQFLKANNLINQKIDGLGFRTVAVVPYLEGKIYENYSGKSYWEWKKSFYDEQKRTDKEFSPVVILDVAVAGEYKNMIPLLDNNYKRYKFEGYLCAKGNLIQAESFIVFIKKPSD